MRWNCAACTFDLCEICYVQEEKKASFPGIVASIPGIVSGINEPTTTMKNDDKNEEDDDKLCVICMVEVKNATIVHGATGHTVCCMECANQLREQNKPCPICRSKIDIVIRNFYS